MFARIVCLAVLTLSAPAFADGLLPKLSSPKASPSAATSREPVAKGPSIDERILFQPTVFPKGYYHRKPETVEDVEFTSTDKTSIHGWFSKAASPKAVVLYCHGNAGNVSVYGRFLERLRRDHRLTVLAFDYRGYGKSGGKPTAMGVVEDGKAARRELARLAGVREEEVVVWGRSLGGAVAVQLAADLDPKALILESTFSSFREVADFHQPALSWLVPKDRLNSVATIQKVECPLFLVHGTADRVVPYDQGKKLYEAAAEPKLMLSFDGYDHNSASPPEFYERLELFLRGPDAAAKK